MKKRIVGLLLLVVMLTLSLVGCGGYSIADDDLSAYATFSETDKADFEKLLEKIIIEDGSFTEDDAVRAEKVMENIYQAFASAANKDDKKKEGTLGAHDIVYYCYYFTAVIDGKTEYFQTAQMKDSKTTQIQLGLKAEDDKVADAIRAAFAGFEFKADNTYSTPVSGVVKPGDIIYVDYTYSYTETNSEGVEKEVTDKITNAAIVVSDKEDTFAGKFNGKSIGTTIADFKVTEEGRGEVSYSGVKINWQAKGPRLTEFKDVTYDEDKNFTNTEGDSRNLKDVELTYHVYPVNFVKVDEFTAINLINIVLKANITADRIYGILFGSDYTGLHEDHDGHDHTEEEKQENDKKLAELNEWLKDYETTDEDGKIVTLKELVEKLAKEQTAYADAKTAHDKSQTTLDEKQAAKDKAQKIVDEAGESATEAQRNDLKKAENALKLANTEFEKTKKTYDETLAARDASVTKLLSFENMETKLTEGYKKTTYTSLQNSYNNEIKTKLANEIYYFMQKNIAVSGAPAKAIDKASEDMLENYEHLFYTGDFDTAKKITNYKQYNGSFKKYLVAVVTKEIKKVATYDEAVAAIREEVTEQLKDIVRIYVVAKAYGDVFVTDKEFEAYKKDTSNNYSYYEYEYGEENVRHAYQIDELLNHLLDSEEKESVDANGYDKVVNDYKNIGYTTEGTPASEAKDESKDDGEKSE